MPQLTLWRGPGIKGNDYKFVDRVLSEQYRIGGVEFWIHKYEGPAISNITAYESSMTTDPILQIQDPLNMENRDRKYDDNIYSLKGHYNMNDLEFDLKSFGLFIASDTPMFSFHENDMVDQLGRRLVPGDVIEVLNQRDDLIIGQPAMNKYYVVEEGSRPADGYDHNWLPHIWRVKCSPMTDSQEFADILDKPMTNVNGDPVDMINSSNGSDTTLGDIIGTSASQQNVANALIAQATLEVPFTYQQGQHLYVLPGDLEKPMAIWNGDGIPPNESNPVADGTAFPNNPSIGDYFLRTDYSPPQLYVRNKSEKSKYGYWHRLEIDYRRSWLPAGRILDSFINNTRTTTLNDGTKINEQSDIKNAVAAKIDPDII